MCANCLLRLSDFSIYLNLSFTKVYIYIYIYSFLPNPLTLCSIVCVFNVFLVKWNNHCTRPLRQLSSRNICASQWLAVLVCLFLASSHRPEKKIKREWDAFGLSYSPSPWLTKDSTTKVYAFRATCSLSLWFMSMGSLLKPRVSCTCTVYVPHFHFLLWCSLISQALVNDKTGRVCQECILFLLQLHNLCVCVTFLFLLSHLALWPGVLCHIPAPSVYRFASVWILKLSMISQKIATIVHTAPILSKWGVKICNTFLHLYLFCLISSMSLFFFSLSSFS